MMKQRARKISLRKTISTLRLIEARILFHVASHSLSKFTVYFPAIFSLILVAVIAIISLLEKKFLYTSLPSDMLSTPVSFITPSSQYNVESQLRNKENATPFKAQKSFSATQSQNRKALAERNPLSDLSNGNRARNGIIVKEQIKPAANKRPIKKKNLPPPPEFTHVTKEFITPKVKELDFDVKDLLKPTTPLPVEIGSRSLITDNKFEEKFAYEPILGMEPIEISGKSTMRN
jgi:hypothetical protein